LNLLSLVRPLLDLPPRRTTTSDETLWVEMPDGARLATRVFRPRNRERGPAVLLRTPYGSRNWRTPLFLLAKLCAEAGYASVVQDVRGRFASEGRFHPFVHEAADGERAVHWLAEQPWCDGRVALAGFSYVAFSAWAARAAAPEPVRAVISGLGASNLHPVFFPGGAFSLETALRWSAVAGEREGLTERQVDLTRAFPFRPVREADRVAVRERPWYREWLDHPRLDDYWSSFRPSLAGAPASLLLAGWYDLFLGPQLEDHAALVAGGADARLVVGPWTHGRYLRRQASPRRRWFGHVVVREILSFLDRHLGEGGAEPDSPVRVHPLAGDEWRALPAWPPAEGEQRLHLRSGGRANTLSGDGRLSPEPPGDEPPDRFSYDPDDPVPTRGGPLLGPGGAVDPRSVEARDDVLCYTGEPLAAGALLAGPVRAHLYVASSAPDTDFTARLVRIPAQGEPSNLCEGIARCRWRGGGLEPLWLEPDTPLALEVDLWATCARLRRGDRLRLEVSSSNFPRFDRNPNTREDPARAQGGVTAQQTVLHDAEHPSCLTLSFLENDTGP